MPSLKPSVLAVLSACSLASFAAGATGLGEMSIISSLGDRFRAEIPLLNPSSSTAPNCFKLTTDSPDAIDEVPWLKDAQIVLLSAPPRLMINTRRPVTDPVIQLAIHSGCGISLTRHYTALLSPLPGGNNGLPVITLAASPKATLEKPGSGNPRATRNTKARTALAGETAGDMARRLYPRSQITQQRFIQQMVELNPEWLISESGDETLPEGVELRYPEIAVRRSAVVRPPAPAKLAVTGRQHATKTEKRDRLVITPSDAPLLLEPALPLATSGEIDYHLTDVERQVGTVRSLLNALRAEYPAPPPDIQLKLVEMESRLLEVQLKVARINLTKFVADTPVTAVLPPPNKQLDKEDNEKASQAINPSPLSATQLVREPIPTTEPLQIYHLGGLVLLGVFGLGLTATLYRRARGGRATLDFGSIPVRVQVDAEQPACVTPGNTTVAADTLPLADKRNEADEKIDRPMPNRAIENPKEIEQPIELANMMLIYGRTQYAVEVLQSFIESDPENSLQATLRLLEIYKEADMRLEFDLMAEQLAHRFNIERVRWDETLSLASDIPGESADQSRTSSFIKNMPPHIQTHVVTNWGTSECLDFLRNLLNDKRDGKRKGFSISVAHAILGLIKTLECDLKCS